MMDRLRPYLRYLALVGAACLAVSLGGLLILGEGSLWIEIAGGVGLVLIAAAALLHPAELARWITGRQARYGGNALLMVLAFVAILGMVNYLGNRYHWRWDVTAEKQFSLSEQTLSILRNLDEPVSVKLFFTPSHYSRQQAQDLITEYDIRSDMVDYEFVDPDLDRMVALEYQIARDGTIVFERGARREVTFGVQEQDFTSALLKVTQEMQRGVSFLTGHGERDSQGSDQRGLSLVRSALENENYAVDTLNLAATESPPERLNVLVVAAPKAELSDEELVRLRSFVDDGVSLLVLSEPGSEEPLAAVLANYGLDVPDAIVVDPARSFFGDVASPLVDSYEFHQITKDMTGMTTFFPTARPLVRSQNAAEGWTVQVLAQSSGSSWGETDYSSQQVGKDDSDIAGPVPLVVAIEPTSTDTGKGRLVVIGDADFCSDAVLQQVRGTGNVDLFMNAVGWLAEEESLISIRPKEQEARQVVLTPPQARGIIYSSILFVPLIVLAGGAVIWWRRR